MAMSTLSFVRRIATSSIRKSRDAEFQRMNMQSAVLPHWQKELEYAKNHGPAGEKKWRAICLFVATPLLILVNVKLVMDHVKHPHERMPFKQYEYMHIRTKKFPWGDGNHSLFFNPKVNCTPQGYEDEE